MPRTLGRVSNQIPYRTLGKIFVCIHFLTLSLIILYLILDP